jgi:hypothetical protein
VIFRKSQTYSCWPIPKSLLRALSKSRSAEHLRHKCSADELRDYFDTVTEKGERSPFLAALAYTVLIALLTKSPGPATPPDASRLHWGPVIRDYLIETFPLTERRIITAETPPPKVTYTSSNSSSAKLGDSQVVRSIINV